MAWYAEMPRLAQQFHTPRFNQPTMQYALPRGRKNIRQQTLQGVIPQYFLKKGCIGCETTILDNSNEGPLCTACLDNPQKTVLILTNKIAESEAVQSRWHEICYSCAQKTVLCRSLDCPILYARLDADAKAANLESLGQILYTLF